VTERWRKIEREREPVGDDDEEELDGEHGPCGFGVQGSACTI
jgi:hypothetical protein